MTATFFKKFPGLTLLGFLLGSQLIWFWAAPGNFKTAWRENPLVEHIIRQHALVQEKSKFVAIAYYCPYLPYFASIIAGNEMPKRDLMEGYYFNKPYTFRTYYQTAVELLPGIDAPHFLLGFCQYYMGNTGAALEQYEKAAELSPDFFWSYYNLGTIYFKQGEFLKSAIVFNKALSLKEEYTLGILRQNPFYQQIWHYIIDPGPALENNLRQGQTDAAIILADCFIKAGQNDQALGIIQSIGKVSRWHQELWEKLRKEIEEGKSSANDIDRLIQEQIPIRLF